MKCNRLFNVNPVLEHENVMSALHLEGKADNWYMDYLEGRDYVGWNVFTAMVIKQFSKEDSVDIVEVFNNLKQRRSVEEYRLKFEEMKAQVVHIGWKLD